MSPSEGWVPPDGGYGWVIAIACMFVMVFAAQSFVDFGIFLLAFIEYYDVSTTIVSIVGAIQMSASGLACKYEKQCNICFRNKNSTTSMDVLVGHV